MPEVTYRPWAEDDDLALLQIWGDPETVQAEQFRAMFGPAAQSPWTRCIVAEDQGVAVAAGVVYASSLHPDRLWAYIEVARDHRRAGIGATLLTMLRREAEQAPDGAVPLKTRVEPSTASAAFAAAAGLHRIQTSRVIVVEAGALAVPDFQEGTGPQLDKAATGSVELTRAVAHFYNAVHGWDRADMTLGRAQTMLLSESAGAGGAVVLRDRPQEEGGTIAAFAISYTAERTEAPADVLIGYDTLLPEDEAEAAVASLLAMLVYQYPVQVEADESMTALNRVLESLLASGTAAQRGPDVQVVAE